MTEQAPEPTTPINATVVEPVPAPSRFKSFRDNHPRLVTAVTTLAGVGLVSGVVSVVKNAKKEGEPLVEINVDTDALNPLKSDASPAKED